MVLDGKALVMRETTDCPVERNLEDGVDVKWTVGRRDESSEFGDGVVVVPWYGWTGPR